MVTIGSRWTCWSASQCVLVDHPLCQFRLNMFSACVYMFVCHSNTLYLRICSNSISLLIFNILDFLVFVHLYTIQETTSTAFRVWRYIIENCWTNLRKLFSFSRIMLYLHLFVFKCMSLKFSIIWFLIPKSWFWVSFVTIDATEYNRLFHPSNIWQVQGHPWTCLVLLFMREEI